MVILKGGCFLFNLKFIAHAPEYAVCLWRLIQLIALIKYFSNLLLDFDLIFSAFAIQLYLTILLCFSFKDMEIFILFYFFFGNYQIKINITKQYVDVYSKIHKSFCCFFQSKMEFCLLFFLK